MSVPAVSANLAAFGVIRAGATLGIRYRPRSTIEARWITRRCLPVGNEGGTVTCPSREKSPAEHTSDR